MRVLMLGWDFSPRLSGGVGSACQGLANALARGDGGARTDVAFVLPRVRGDEEARDVHLFSGADAERLRDAAPVEPVRAPRPAPGAAPRAATRAMAPVAAPHGAARAMASVALAEAAPHVGAPMLPSPAEALRLLALDSPLQPYLTPDEYDARVAPLRAAHWLPDAARAVLEERDEPHTVPEARGEPRAGASGAAERDEPPPAPSAAIGAASDVPVPPYGRTLVAEVERYAREVLALARRERFDVIHAHDWMTFPAALLLAERTGKPLVVHFHSSEAERRGRGTAPDPDVRAIEQAALDRADRVVCVSGASARTLRAHYAVELAKLRVVHGALAPLATPPPSRPRRARRARRPRTVLFLGRLSEQKAPDVFLRAAALVRRRVRGARFVLAGEGALYPELVALARALGLGRAVRFTGFVGGAELAQTYADADAYVLSSAAEPFGIGALEALSLGVPAIVPRGAGVTEVVRSVLRFEPLDHADLADKIAALLRFPALRRQLAADGLGEVREIRWDGPARLLRGIYDELVLSRG